MKRVLLCALSITAACAHTPSSPSSTTPSASASGAEAYGYVEIIRPGLVVRQVAGDTWVVTHEEIHDSNVLLARMGDGTLLIASSPFDSDSTRAVLAWAHAFLAPTRIVAINTHWHADGTGGNAVYREDSVVTYASTHTQALLAERGESMRTKAAEGFPPAVAERIRTTPVVAAEETFDEATGLTLTFADERVDVIYPGPAHSADNVVVHLAERKVLFGGCMLKVGDSIGYLGDASLDTWEPALHKLEPLEARVVIPGHGKSGGREIIANTLRLVREERARH